MSGAPGSPGVARLFQEAIEAELDGLERDELMAAAARLSERYRSERAARSQGFSPTQAQAYLAVRAPATFAATRRVLAELASVKPDFAPESLVDLGAGPGTATFAAVDVFDSLKRAVLVEQDRAIAALGARLFSGGLEEALGALAWTASDAAAAELPESDLVVAAYVLGELGGDRELPALERWWAATRGELVIIEPGTPAGFERLRRARSALVSLGAHLTAPCPHDRPCPMVGSDWCHFAVRLERSGLHRDLKRARLSYEDEKFSYLVVSSTPVPSATARLLRSPRRHKGHVRLVLCEPGGSACERVVSKREGEVYRRARDAHWGDRLEVDARI